MLEVANNKIWRSIRARTVERSHDPRKFALVAHGGAGLLHADALWKDLALSKGTIPPLPGMASALGCIVADARHDFIQTLNGRLSDLDIVDVDRVFVEHEVKWREMLTRKGWGQINPPPRGPTQAHMESKVLSAVVILMP